MSEFDFGEFIKFIFEAQDRGETVDAAKITERFPGCEEQLLPILQTLQLGDQTFGAVRQRKSGDIVADYRLLKRIGEGSNGEVWQAETVNTRQIVALKLMHPRYAESFDKASRARFEAESNALLLLNHENIARVLRPSPIDAPIPFIAMEYLAGSPPTVPPQSNQAVGELDDPPAESITEYCRRMKLGMRQRIELFIPICRAISYAHRNTIIHRDLKPSNILITFKEQQPIPKVIDFGLAKGLIGRLQDLTMASLTTDFVGTLMYAAPEQVDPAKWKQTERSTSPDIFSLGVVLFEILTGTTPCKSDGDTQVNAAAIIKTLGNDRDLPRMSDKVRRSSASEQFAHGLGLTTEHLQLQLRTELDWIVDKALKKSPADRYATADDLADDLECHLANLRVSARPPSWSLQLQKFLVRNRILSMAMGATACAIVLGIVGLTFGLLRASQAAEDARAAQQQEASQRELAESILQFVRDDFLELTTSLGQVRRLGTTIAVSKNATLRDLLDRAAAKLSGPGQLKPQVRAELLQLVGGSYRNIGEYQKAIDALALAAQEYTSVDDSERWLATRTELAFCRCELGEFDAGFAELGEILEEHRKRNGLESRESFELLLVLGDACYRATRHDEGLDYRRQAADVCRKLLGEESPQYLICQNRIAESLHSLRKVDEALAEYTRLRPMIARAFGEGSLEAMHVENCMAIALRDQGDRAAIPLFRSVLTFRESVFEDDHPLVNQGRENLAIALRDAGEFPEALQLFSAVLAARTATLPEKHSLLISTKGDLALCQAMAGDLPKATVSFSEVYAEALDALGPTHEETLKAGANLSTAMMFGEKYEEAFALLVDLLPRHEDVYGLEFKDTLGCVQTYVVAATALGKQDEARERLDGMIDRATKELGSDHAAISELKNLRKTLEASGGASGAN